MDTKAVQQETKPFTTGDIAKFCHVSHRAVLKWVISGKLQAYRTPGKHSRVKSEDFLCFLHQYHMPVPEELRSSSVARKKVLIVDDDRGTVHSLKRILMLENKYDIETAFDGFIGGRKFAQFKPDLVILDIYMPGLDGYEVCSDIRRNPNNKHVKILAISGMRDQEEIKKIMNLGADDYLFKPFSNKMLKVKISKFLGEPHE